MTLSKYEVMTPFFWVMTSYFSRVMETPGIHIYIYIYIYIVTEALGPSIS